MVIVPSFCPDVPALRKNPVFLYSEDDFKKPNPFEPDVVVPIDPVLDQKVAAIDALESQFYEWNPWLFGYLDEVPKGKAERLAWTRDAGRAAVRRRSPTGSAPSWSSCSGPEQGKAVKYAEAFEVCEYGIAAVDGGAAARSSRSSTKPSSGTREAGRAQEPRRRRRGDRRPGLECQAGPAGARRRRSAVDADQSGGVSATAGPPQRRRWSLSM